MEVFGRPIDGVLCGVRDTVELPERVRRAALEARRETLGSGAGVGAGAGAGRPVYVYDLEGLADHAARIRAALPGVELFYAAKANPDAPVLAALAPHIDGVEVASGGELEHVRHTLPQARVTFGGPGKTDHELELALRLGAERIHVESPYELRRLTAIATQLGAEADILLRANPEIRVPGAALTMDGPFGMDDAALVECVRLLSAPDGATPLPIRLRGVHLHVASGLDRPAMLELAERLMAWTRRPGSPMAALAAAALASTGRLELNLGGGMGVSYEHPGRRFDWAGYGRGLAAFSDPRTTLRIEPGRAVTAYHGWYVTEVLDIKSTRGSRFAVLRGGTHHLRTPVTKGHDQPFTVLPRAASVPGAVPGAVPGTAPGTAPGTVPATPDGAAVTLVGQLCTPKDVFARAVPIDGGLSVGDLVVFSMAGAYAWNISHHDFLMHPKPHFHYLGNGRHISG